MANPAQKPQHRPLGNRRFLVRRGRKQRKPPRAWRRPWVKWNSRPPLKTLTSLVMVQKRSFVFFLMVDGWSLQLRTTTNTSCKWTWWTIQDRIHLLHIVTYCHLPYQLLGHVLSIHSSILWFQISIMSFFNMFFFPPGRWSTCAFCSFSWVSNLMESQPLEVDMSSTLRILTPQVTGVILRTPKHPWVMQVHSVFHYRVKWFLGQIETPSLMSISQ